MSTIPTPVALGDIIDPDWGNAVANAINKFDGWTAYTPTFTNITTGNGTKAGGYIKVGKLVFWYAQFTFGTTSAITGAPRVSCPVAMASTYIYQCDVRYLDNGTGYKIGGTLPWDSAGVGLSVVDSSPTYAGHAIVSSTVPFTWASMDVIYVTGWYLAA